ncbi:STAS domain-containing protein [Neisseria weaveri]|uniref:NTP binding protein n=1 Tax=Neisseria weaveri TaxID=28091 RepID=A0A3S4Z982_9NEIS|nr:STAS domain-containing protein [Neisseria weaveri]EGV36805.1 hypothetical protein l11_15540 [Neisseria weaveri LMG 5135]EGV37287.1 hypothetical protein l13_03980 [Neisseria weaveri ATCC 51223]SAY51791.1 NTP binding protein [Neisseria weaveri]VEJ51211.1 NTP binding protein [Neisseria weaveri]
MNSEIRDGILYIQGEVTVKTVTTPAYTQFEQQCRLKNINMIDGSGVTRADSTCISLLLTALRLKSDMRFRNIPESVAALADLYEIKDWVKQ